MLYLLPGSSVQLPVLEEWSVLGAQYRNMGEPLLFWLLQCSAVSGAHYIVVWGGRTRDRQGASWPKRRPDGRVALSISSRCR